MAEQRELLLSQQALRDMDEAFRYLARHAGAETAVRFDGATETAFEGLSRMPGMGAPRDIGTPGLQDLREWAVPGFRRYLIFYRDTGRAMEVLRVLHAARDLETILTDEPVRFEP